MNSSIASRSNDAILTSKVKATYIDAKDLQANAFKVVTEYGTVFLLGRVTEREANRAANLAAGISGVKKVVRVFEILTEDELAGLKPANTPEPAT
jgi:osmotically-inducible protein OsmY